ncbi:hypothetical protein CH063_03751 [Colletotrichum higginsianum]|uniref:Uncharacterized protein n=1 Tax=Colletotrichum higginsianum (strain IMI 349063) TaxID=759273 RepID=H1W0H4_COLHI|nr:hypothetical protein CH63R_06782 [Colletotrichum higginsianum IMI 349063]OBR11090.1 hypothetical protein CH63R_06782 [Colletotrichum higginsianum IMI 349063]CCF45987.1 hypothetical protein CH063_03751 [Colletotrichum higginsianum]
MPQHSTCVEAKDPTSSPDFLFVQPILLWVPLFLNRSGLLGNIHHSPLVTVVDPMENISHDSAGLRSDIA